MTHLSRRRVAASLPAASAATLLVLVLVSPGGARAAGARPASVGACRAAELSITLHSLRGGGSAGATTLQLEYANLGPTCTLRGYPGVSAVTSGDHQLGAAATRSSARERTVTLPAPGRFTYSTAVSYVRFTDIANYPASRCPPTIAFGLKVYAPDQGVGQIVPAPFPACRSGSATFLQVSPVS